MRLVARNGSTVGVREGRVEVCFNETWGTVSDNGWSVSEVGVVCRQLGYSRFSEFTVCKNVLFVCCLLIHVTFTFIQMYKPSPMLPLAKAMVPSI